MCCAPRSLLLTHPLYSTSSCTLAAQCTMLALMLTHPLQLHTADSSSGCTLAAHSVYSCSSQCTATMHTTELYCMHCTPLHVVFLLCNSPSSLLLCPTVLDCASTALVSASMLAAVFASLCWFVQWLCRKGSRYSDICACTHTPQQHQDTRKLSQTPPNDDRA